MKVKSLTLFLFSCLSILLFSCDRPNCNNTNPVFENFTPESREYKAELAKQMQKIRTENLQFWFDKSTTINSEDFYELFVQGKGLCAKIIVENDMSTTKLSNGGFRGAELLGVIIDIEKDSSGTKFLLKRIEKILD